MKKNYLFGISLLLAGSTFAQVDLGKTTQKIENRLNTELVKVNNNTAPAKNPGDVLWTNDFSDPTDWTIDNAGQTGLHGWNINATEESWHPSFTLINSTSRGNFAELVNGDPTATPPTMSTGVVYKLTTANPITIPNNKVVLSFQQFGARFNDAQEVYVSIDGGTTWILAGSNAEIPALSTAGGAYFANPTLKTINLASKIPASATSILVRFQWTTALPVGSANYNSPNAWITYGWAIDDVSISENYEYDLSLNKVVWGVEGLNYYQTPISQIQPIEIGGSVTNNGTQTITDAVFTATVAGASFTGTSNPTTIAPTDTTTLLLSTNYTPAAAVGSHTISAMSVNSALHPDEAVADNGAANITFAITNNIYARDKGTRDGFTSDPDKLPYEVGNLFDIWSPVSVKAVDVFIDPSTSTGAAIYVTIRDNQLGDVPINQSEEYVIKATDKNKFITVKFDEWSDLSEGTYFIGAGTQGGVGLNDLVIGNSGISDKQTTFVKDGPTWFYTLSTPMIRLNLDQTLGIDKVENSIVEFGKLFPNPTSGEATINYTLKNNADVTVKVIDVTGKTVYTANQGSQATGSHELSINADSFSNGVYYVTISANDMQVTQMLVKK